MKDIALGIDRCKLFVFFGQSHYGEDTGNPMSSHREFKMAAVMNKPMAWIKMGDDITSPEVRMHLAGINGGGIDHFSRHRWRRR